MVGVWVGVLVKINGVRLRVEVGGVLVTVGVGVPFGLGASINAIAPRQ
jgi:hypothetical protein